MALLTGILQKFKRSHATEPPLIVQQIGAGIIQQWTTGETLPHGTEKARINNDGSFTGSGMTISGATPTLVFEDTTGGDDDFQFIANGDILLLEIPGGQDIASFRSSGVTLLAPVTVDGTTDILLKANGQIVGYERTIEVDSSTVGNVGGGTDTLHTFSLPANSLAADEDYLDVWYGGNFATNDNDKALTFSFGGTAYEGTGARDLDTAIGWMLHARIVRLSSTSVRVSCHLAANQIGTSGAEVLVGFATGSVMFGRNFLITGLSDLGANATTMLVQGAATSDNDVTQNVSIIKLTQMT